MATALSGHELAVGRRERHPVLGLLRHLDLALIGSAVALGLIGIVMVYSATRSEYGSRRPVGVGNVKSVKAT